MIFNIGDTINGSITQNKITQTSKFTCLSTNKTFITKIIIQAVARIADQALVFSSNTTFDLPGYIW